MGTYLRELSSSVYLAALALSDNGFLLCVLISWANNVSFDLYHRQGWCQMFVYLTYVFSFLSVWYVVGFTVERFIAVCFPFRRSAMCTLRRAKIVVSCMALGALVAYSFALWTSEVQQTVMGPQCYTAPGYNNFLYVVSNTDTVVTLVIPWLLILSLNVRIACSVSQLYRKRQQITAKRASSNLDTPVRHHHGRSANTRQVVHANSQVKVTKMLLVVSTIFLVLNLPSHAFRVHIDVTRLINAEYNPSYIYLRWKTLVLYVYYLNFAVNFFLYSFCGKNFRLALKALVLRRKVTLSPRIKNTGHCENASSMQMEFLSVNRSRNNGCPEIRQNPAHVHVQPKNTVTTGICEV